MLSVSNTTYIHKKYSINSSYDAQSPGISWNFWVPLASLRAGASVLRSMRALRVLRAFRLLRLLKMSRLSAWGEISVQISHFFRLSYVLQPVPSCTYKILQIRISYFKFILILCYCFDMILLCLEFITMFYCYFSMHTLTYNHICMCIYIYICIIFYIVIQMYYYRWCDTCIYNYIHMITYAYTVLLNILNLSSYFLGDWAIQSYKNTPLSRGN